MSDINTVVKGLGIAALHLNNLAQKCAMYSTLQADADCCIEAIESLKEKEHSGSFIVIDTKTGKEAVPYDIALHEEWAKHLCYCDMDGWALQDDGSLLLLDECGRFAYADRERFKVVWDA